MTIMTRRAAIYFLFFLSCIVPGLVARDGVALPLKLDIDPVSGSYSIQVGASAGIGDRVATTNNTWLWSAETRLGDWSSEDGTLLLSDFAKGKGCDRFGPFEAQTLGWSIPNSSDIVMYTSFVTYPHEPSMVVMEQYFPTAFVNTKEFSDKNSNNNNTLSAVTLFPSFQRLPNATQSLACVSYHGVFPSMKYVHLSDYAESHLGGAPLVIYNETDPLLPAIILSPLDWPMAQHMASSPTMFGAGVKATVAEIPAGWRHQFILSAAYGISNAFEAWGDRMTTPKKSNDAVTCTCKNHRLRHTKTGSRCDREKHRLDRSSNMYRYQTHSTIGFWTDNGGYYHYNTGVANATYEEVLPQVKKYHDSIGIPFGHWQLDSWFYPKDAKTNPGGGGGAVVNWTSMPSVFPSGMAAFQRSIGLPMVLHNRQWSMRSDYVNHWTEIPWYSGPNFAIPQDPEAFFRRFFSQQVGWGLTMYEQDWMCTQYDGTEALKTNISLADLWLQGMAIGAAAHNLTVQYCMPYPNQILAAATLSSTVTNARATGDYMPNTAQWAIGATSLFYWALGILPFKDGFYSSTLPQIGGQTKGPELRPDLHALMATLSVAMVGPMDGINLMNATRIKATCRSDGKILKPDMPVRTSDGCFYRPTVSPSAATAGGDIPHDPFSCYVYLTHSDVPGLGRVRYLFSNDTDKPLTPAMAHVGGGTVNGSAFALYNWYTRDLGLFGEQNKVLPGYEDFSYSMITPILPGGWIFLGEVDKYVPVSRLRFSKVSALDRYHLQVEASGVPGEQIRLCTAKVVDLTRIHCENIVFQSTTLHSVIFESLASTSISARIVL